MASVDKRVRKLLSELNQRDHVLADLGNQVQEMEAILAEQRVALLMSELGSPKPRRWAELYALSREDDPDSYPEKPELTHAAKWIAMHGLAESVSRPLPAVEGYEPPPKPEPERPWWESIGPPPGAGYL